MDVEATVYLFDVALALREDFFPQAKVFGIASMELNGLSKAGGADGWIFVAEFVDESVNAPNSPCFSAAPDVRTFSRRSACL